jgi:UDP-2-acetamido-2-deoxy-ribo-hexuluronate aminotransferase
MQFIDLKQQYKLIKDDVLDEINQVLESGQYIMGNKVKELECNLADYVKVKHAVGVADGTKALLIALMALGVSRDDEVIVPAFTFFATASMAALLGAKPVFVDIDPISYTLDPSLLEAAITPKTKAIIPVSLYGQCADLDAINIIAHKHNIAVIEDAAQSFGATYKRRHSGGLTTIAITSFFPSKPLGCYGDGGACFTNDDALALKMQQIRIHGQDKRYHHSIIGVNGRIDTLQAAILLAKLRIFDNEVIQRDKIGKRYTELLSGTNCVTPFVMPYNTHVYAQYTLLVENRDQFVKNLNQEGIPTAVHYPVPLHHQPALKQYCDRAIPYDLPHSESVAKKVVSLPMHPYLDEATQDHIVAVVKKYL